MKLAKLFRRVEATSLSGFVDLLKPLKAPRVRIHLSGNKPEGKYWPYVICIEARLNSGELIFFKEEKKLHVADVPSDEQMAFVNNLAMAISVEETVRVIKMFFPDAKILVWDLYGERRELEEFVMQMRA